MNTKNVKLTFIAVCTAIVFPLTASFAQSGHHQDTKGHERHNMHEKQTGDPKFKDEKIGTAYQHYLHVKSALVSSDASEAKSGAEMLAASLKEVSNAATAHKAAASIAQTSALEEQRKAFITLSEAMTDLVQSAISSGEVYKSYCPMANDNKGAYWLASEKEIRNPYFGDKMLKCGSVKETIQ